MITKRILSLVITVALCMSLLPAISLTASAEDAPAPAVPIFEDPTYSYAERAADLVARMTATQKGAQMIDGTAAITAAQLGGGAMNVPATMGVNSYTWWSEALHGYSRGNPANAVSYPQNYSLASTWDPDLYYSQAVQIGDEIRESSPKVGATAKNAGNNTNLVMYSPTVNLSRDPRWGRNEEGYSEDPYLTAVMGTNFVNGMQGNDKNGNPLDKTVKVITTTKHYTANNSERNRLTGGATMTLSELRDYFTAPYRDIIKNANVQSVMVAYSSINNEPVSKSSYLMETLLRQIYGLDGYITSDCDSYRTVANFNYINPYTGQVLTQVEKLAQIMAHGGDHECSGGYGSGSTYSTAMAQMLAESPRTNKGLFTENQLDVSVWRHFVARMKTGEFDIGANVSKYVTDAQNRIATQTAVGGASRQTQERLDLTEKTANDAVVLLKNDAPRGSAAGADSLLPLKPLKDEATVVIAGGQQTSSYLGLYSASVTANRINIREGIVNAINAANPGKKINYVYLSASSVSSFSITEEEEAAVKNADLVVVTLGTQTAYSREDGDRGSIALPNDQAGFASKLGKLNSNTVVTIETCGSVEVDTFKSDVAAILWSSFQGMRKVGFGNVITGAVNPGAKVTSTWYTHVADNDPSSVIPDILDYTLYPVDGKPGRTYMYYNGPVSYEFGYGLSYTKFEYSNIKVLNGATPSAAFDANDTITVTADIKNTGARAGSEIAQLYVAQPGAPAQLLRPIHRLKGFNKVDLAPGETKTVTFNVKIADLAFYNEAQDRFIVDTGAYQLQVGASSRTLPLKADISISGSVKLVPAVVTAKPSQNGDAAIEVEERLIFDKGKIVDPKIAVALNDESLYGYIIKDQQDKVKHMPTSVALPEGMTVSYTSNRPSVVSVDGDVIRTVAPGVATITATVTYNGASATGEFVVYVVASPYPDAITVNGTPLEGFSPKTKFNYPVSVAKGTTAIPVVAATGGNPDFEANITQATSIPGIATVVCKDKVTGASATYYVGFGWGPESDDFSAGTSKWTVLNSNAENVSAAPNALAITTEKGFFGTDTAPKNVFLQPAMGNWVAQTFVSFSATPTASNQQAGLILYGNDTNYIRFVYERPTTGTTNVIRVYNVVNGTQTQSNTVNLAAQTGIYLQVVKQGETYTFVYSTNGTNWTTFATKVTANYALPQVGLLANNGNTAAAAITATFTKFGVFDVADMYPTLSGISLNGVPLGGFDPSVYAYTVDSLDGTVQTVSATGADSKYTVSVVQATGVPGSAVITVATDVASVIYTVFFSEYPTSTSFVAGNMDSKWSVLRENKATYSVDKGLGLRLPTQRYEVGSANAWENVFVRPATGNWEAVAKMYFPKAPNAGYQQIALLVVQDDTHFFKLDQEYNGGQQTKTANTGGGSGGGALSANYFTAASDGSMTLYFKITKDGNSYQCSASKDGLSYVNVGTPIVYALNNPQIGLMATRNNSSAEINSYCEYITITDLNGVKQLDYDEMLTQAVDNVASYVVADIPAVLTSDIAFSPMPRGYTVSVASSDPAAVDSDGKVTRGAATKNVNLSLTISDGTFSVVKTKVVSLPKASVDAVSSVKTLVEGRSANVVVTLTGSDLNGLQARLFGKTLNIVNGTATFSFKANELYVPGNYTIDIIDSDSFVVAKAPISIVAEPAGLWAPKLVIGEGSFTVTFGSAITFNDAKKAVTIGAGPAVDSALITVNGAVLTVAAPVQSGQKVTVSGVKYAELFPSYSFSFGITA